MRRRGSRARPYWLEAYYGPGGRAGGQGLEGEREGDLCIAVEYGDTTGRDVEEEILRNRSDIDTILKGEWTLDREAREL